MLETNEEYMSQEKLDSILSGTVTYNPSQKELDTKVLYDDYYVYLIDNLLMTILILRNLWGFIRACPNRFYCNLFYCKAEEELRKKNDIYVFF